jgi:hypothetical protein
MSIDKGDQTPDFNLPADGGGPRKRTFAPEVAINFRFAPSFGRSGQGRKSPSLTHFGH